MLKQALRKFARRPSRLRQLHATRNGRSDPRVANERPAASSYTLLAVDHPHQRRRPWPLEDERLLAPDLSRYVRQPRFAQHFTEARKNGLFLLVHMAAD